MKSRKIILGKSGGVGLRKIIRVGCSSHAGERIRGQIFILYF
jgi:hypothetical protein